MTNLEKFQQITTSVNKFADWIDKHCFYDNTPWMDWWDKNYCDKCESIILSADECKELTGIEPLFASNLECAYCEVYHKCKYFPDLEETPSMKDIVKMWLAAESNE